ncbi:DUF4870 domain-containing protein [Gelidibacter maritimus]|uniref:DUF4870 domain-containing protein n=1 Tax=Gelidibacter maritimus TaxID=2761487 RepID=A0A7W2M7Y0_9FLAO|nr:DUF4870 domain-containing protein [Gelidibacter maritimus]MBA6154350.1 DUF4870 domain-containing protein [Gelidibacter maritimus]
MIDNHHRNIATFIHLSTFSRFIVPLGNFIGPLILWSVNKEKSEFIDTHGKQAINFQISILLYAIILGVLTVPFFIFGLLGQLNFWNFSNFDNFQIGFHSASPLLFIAGGFGFLAVIGFILELIFIVIASLKARDGEIYKYPLTINFLK